MFIFVFEVFGMHFGVYVLNYGRAYAAHMKSDGALYTAADELLSKTRHGNSHQLLG